MNEGIPFKHVEYDTVYTAYPIQYQNQNMFVIVYGTGKHTHSAIYTEKEWEENLQSGVWYKI